MDSTCGCKVFAYLSAGRRIVQFAVEDGEHAIQRADQALDLAALPELDLVELFLGAFVNRGHAAQEHLGQLIPCADLHTPDQGHQQGVTLRFGTLAQLGHVIGHGLGGEVANLGVGKACKYVIPRRDRIQPFQMLHQHIEMLAGRAFRGFLELVVFALAAFQFVRDQQRL